jgi:hypothetical protein
MNAGRRRVGLTVRAIVCAAAALALAATAWADEAMDRAQRIHAHLIGVDSHNDTLQRVLHGHEDISRRTPRSHVDLPRLKEAGMVAPFFALWVPTYYHGVTRRAVNLQRRLEGARSVLDRHPGIQVVEVYDIKEDPVRCAEIIASGTNRYPDLGAWISVGGWPVFTRNALQAVDPARTKFVSFDTIPPAPDLLREGKVQVLIGQKYFGWGSESVRLLADIKAGKRPPSPIVDSGVDVVTAANVDDYVAGWKKLEAGQ